MANPALDQFLHALMWKAVPVIILCGGGAILLKELIQWLERRAIQFGQERKQQRLASKRVSTILEVDTPHCPVCNSLMVRRTAKRGANAGSEFWGCPSYPTCRGTRNFKEDAKCHVTSS
jgi:hypothetical protein